jgi:hypothetical protein
MLKDKLKKYIFFNKLKIEKKKNCLWGDTSLVVFVNYLNNHGKETAHITVLMTY